MRREYTIPKNKCQVCYRQIGRFILDCYCILCEQCYRGSSREPVCNLCGKPTKNNFIDAKNQSSINKISHLFGNVDSHLNKTVEIYKFQQSITNRYCAHLESRLAEYEDLVKELLSSNPNLEDYIASRLKINYSKKSKPSHSVPSLPMREVRQMYPSTGRSLWTGQSQAEFTHKIKEPSKMSGRGVYHVPSINYSTAVRSSKRAGHRQEDYSRR